MLIIRYLNLIRRLLFRRICPAILLFLWFYVTFISYEKPSTPSIQSNFKSLTDEFILQYKPYVLIGNTSDITRVEPTIERIRSLLEILRSKEDKYQSLLETFNVFNILNPMISLKSYTNESNIDEIKIVYNRYIKLTPDQKTIEINQTFIDYLKQISSYLLDGFKDKRTNQVNQKTKILFNFIHFFFLEN